MTKEEFLKAIMELPKVETINPKSAMNSINIDDLMNAIDRLNKVPDYNDLLKENKKLKECYCNRIDCSGRIKNSRKYDSLYQKYNKQLDNWNKLKEDLIKIRQLTFTKYNKNEWENCLSFNDDILPLIEKMKELQGSDNK